MGRGGSEKEEEEEDGHRQHDEGRGRRHCQWRQRVRLGASIVACLVPSLRGHFRSSLAANGFINRDQVDSKRIKRLSFGLSASITLRKTGAQKFDLRRYLRATDLAPSSSSSSSSSSPHLSHARDAAAVSEERVREFKLLLEVSRGCPPPFLHTLLSLPTSSLRPFGVVALSALGTR